MNLLPRTVPVVAFAAFAAVAVGALADTDPAGLLPYHDKGATTRGAAIYRANSASCHGAALEGQDNWRERDADGYLPAPPHNADGHTWHHPDSQLFMITKYGTEALVGGDYRSNMMGFQDVLSDEDILEVLAYIKSTWPDRVIGMHDKINRDAGL